jgi:hypothetical protein
MIQPTSENRANPEWPRARLEHVVVFRSGYRNSDAAVEGGEFPFFVCSNEVLRSNEYDFDDEAVIMSGNNADGVFHLHHFIGKFAARQRTYVITPRTRGLDCRWLYHQLEVLQPSFQAAAIGTTTKYVTIEMLRRAEIPLPELAVQQAISEAMSDVDALLAKLDQLIAKKRDLKQAAMQQLLTGQTRLPGFSGEWEMKRLGDVFSITAGKSKSAYIMAGGPYWIVDMGSVSIDGKLNVSKPTNHCGDFLKAGDLVMPKDDIGGGCLAPLDAPEVRKWPRIRPLQSNALRADESNGWIAASPDQRKPHRSCRRRGGLKDVRNNRYILLTNGDHSMSQLSKAILSAAQALPEGGLISPKEFLHLASRAAVDQALARLAREGKLLRVGRGAYALPVASRFRSRPPSTEAVVEAIASTHGEVVVPNGAAEANALGPTTQVPTREIFLTSGPTRKLRLGMRMAESWFALSQADRVEAVEYAAAQSGRPAHLLEKDIWVVWTLSAIYASPTAARIIL